MATEDAGLELHVDGEDDFNESLEKANEALAALSEAALSLADVLESSSGSINSANEAFTEFSEAAEANSEAVGEAGETAEGAEDAIAGLGESAEESAEGIDDSAESVEEADDALKDFADGADAAGGSFDAASEIIIGGLRRIGEVAVNSLMAAGAALVDFASDSFTGAIEAEEVIAKLNSTIAATKGAAGVTSEAAQEIAGSLAKVTKFGDDSIVTAETLLLTFTNIGSDVFPRATETLLDMATIMGTDASSGAIQLGKALNDPIGGISALSRVGVAFTEEQEKMIKNMVAAGDVAGAQTVILDELQREFGGAAKAAGETFGGKLEILKNRLGEVGEGIAGAFLPAISSFVDGLMPAFVVVEDLAGSFSTLVTALTTGDFTGGIFGLSEDDPAIGALMAMRDGILTVFDAVESFPEDPIKALAYLFYSLAYDNGIPAFRDIADAVMKIPGVIEGAGTAFDDLVARAQPVIMASENLAAAFESSMPAIQGAVEHALTFVKNLWDTVFPSIQSTTDNTLNQIMNLTATILNAIAAYWDENGATILAQATFFIESTFAIIGGTLTLISGVVSATLSVINGDWDAAGAALTSSTDAFMNAILSIVGTDLESFKATWSEVFTLAKTIIDTQMAAAAAAFSRAVEAIRVAAEPVESFINKLLDSFKGFYNWLATHVFSFQIELPELPDWAIPGSPTPFEMGLRGIDKALKQVAPEVREFAYSISMMPPDNPVSPPASAGQIAAQSVYNSSLSNSLTINAQYPMQSARSVADDLSMWSMLTGNSAA